MTRVRSVAVHPTGTVSVFDQDQNRVPELEGPLTLRLSAILARVDDETPILLTSWPPGQVIEIDGSRLLAIAEEFKQPEVSHPAATWARWQADANGPE
jgi:hypothetical protein